MGGVGARFSGSHPPEIISILSLHSYPFTRRASSVSTQQRRISSCSKWVLSRPLLFCVSSHRDEYEDVCLLGCTQRRLEDNDRRFRSPYCLNYRGNSYRYDSGHNIFFCETLVIYWRLYTTSQPRTTSSNSEGVTFLSNRHVASRSLSRTRYEQWYGCHRIWLQMQEVLWEHEEHGSSQRPISLMDKVAF